MRKTANKEYSSSIKDFVTPDDIIAGIFCQLKPERIPANPIKIHKAFYELKKKYSDILDDFDFFEGNINPFSKLLERVLFRLEQARLIGTINPSYDIYDIPNDQKEKFKEMVLFRFSRVKKEKLRNIAEELGEMLVRI